jgi:hypothetical protein
LCCKGHQERRGGDRKEKPMPTWLLRMLEFDIGFLFIDIEDTRLMLDRDHCITLLDHGASRDVVTSAANVPMYCKLSLPLRWLQRPHFAPTVCMYEHICKRLLISKIFKTYNQTKRLCDFVIYVDMCKCATVSERLLLCFSFLLLFIR